MNLANLTLADLTGGFLGLVLTLIVFSYVFGDNLVFRLAISIFVGVASGYAAVITWYNVIWPQLLLPLIAGDSSERLYLAFPMGLSVLLLFKASPRLARLGNPAIAYLVGAGVATSIGGAVLGTIFPQVNASINLFDPQAAGPVESSLWLQLLRGSVVLIGTLTTLIYFHFGVRRRPGEPARRQPWVELLAVVGHIFIAMTFGVLFAGVYSAALTALVERIQFMGDFILPLFLNR